jgi:hypothetical protein
MSRSLEADMRADAARKASLALRRRRLPLGKLTASATASCRFIPMASRDRPLSCATYSSSFSTKLSGTNSGNPHREVRHKLLMVPYTGGTPQIINDVMGKNGRVGIKVLIAQGSLLAQKGLASA